MDVVIVESPAKAKTINKYLGKNYKVLASYGHVRDLPSKDGSVLPDEDFAMTWEADAKSKKRLSEIAAAVKESDKLILATDPDREGEAISWHVLQVLKNKRVLKDKPIQRVVFNAITKDSILDAMEHPRDIDAPLVDAYLARRALDYLVGFTLSPVLWRKLPGARSAGRVQSVALRLICEREEEIERFIPQEYWSILADLQTAAGADFQARITAVDGVKKARHDIATEAEAADIKQLVEQANLSIRSIEAKPVRRNPFAPFTTSTLQQEASRKLGFAAARTMQIAQKLYEGISLGGETTGLITYMRTDGVQIAPEAIAPIRDAIAREFGKDYVPDKSSSSIPPKRKMLRKPTKRSVPPISTAIQKKWHPISTKSSSSFTRSFGAAPWPARWNRLGSNARRSKFLHPTAPAMQTCVQPGLLSALMVSLRFTPRPKTIPTTRKANACLR